MRSRLLRVGALAGTLFAINVAARVLARFAYGDGTPEHLAAQDRLTWLGWGAVALVMAVTAAWWAQRRPQGGVAGELAGAGAAAGGVVAVAGVLAQEGFRGRVDLVRLPVVVLGADGRPVTGLGAEDFEVLEDTSCEESAIYAVSLPTRHTLPKVRAFIDLVADELRKRGGK